MVVSFTCPLTPNAYYPLSLLRGSVKVLVAQSCLTLCDPADYSPPSSYVHGILQARMLEWVPIPFSRHLPSPGTEPEPSALQAYIYLLSHQRSSVFSGSVEIPFFESGLENVVMGGPDGNRE